MKSLYIVMPAYNEAENIEATIKQWYPIVEKVRFGGADCKLVVGNDGSRDDTLRILQDLKENYPNLIPLSKNNTGHGATLLYLYRYALENNADYVFQTDSDGQTDPDEFWDLWSNRDCFDVQIGNRYSRQDGRSRKFVSTVLRVVVYLIFHEWVKDANTPFRLMNADKLEKLMTVIPNDFFLCNVAIAAIAQKWNYKVRWCNITFKPRQGGKNSINMRRIFKIGWKALWDFKIISKKLG